MTQRLSYDAWGLPRHADGTPDPSAAGGGGSPPETTRGLTGHEHLCEVGLIHMGGRVYDPLLARFGTPDPVTEDPYSTQGWNRYSYVGNSPLNFTDPSGYCFLGCFWQPAFKAVGQFLQRFWGAIVQTVVPALVCGPAAPMCAAAVGAITNHLYRRRDQRQPRLGDASRPHKLRHEHDHAERGRKPHAKACGKPNCQLVSWKIAA